jgi:glycerate kinase
MRILIAPDKFKGTFPAAGTCEAIAEGARRADPGADCVLLPLADGGEGTVEVLLAARGGRQAAATVRGPLGEPVEAGYALLEGGDAVIEMAAAAGLHLVPEGARDPDAAGTHGVGDLIASALEQGARRVLVGLGGSATVEGGAGMAVALGYELLDAEGRRLSGRASDLRRLAAIEEGDEVPERLVGRTFVALCDVRNPLLGEEGAARVFGPQKGASQEQVGLLEEGLITLAGVAESELGVPAELRDRPGAGAAGGLGWGAGAFLGGELHEGARTILDAVGFDEALRGADLLLTGEGSYDEQSAHGKAAAEALRRAREAGVPAAVVCARGRAGEGVFRGEDLPGYGDRLLDAEGLAELARRAVQETLR